MKKLILTLLFLAVARIASAQIVIPDPGEPAVSPGPGSTIDPSSAADTTIKTGGVNDSWVDTDGRVFENANIYKHKALYVLVSDGAASGKIVIRIQGSATGASTDFQDIITPHVSSDTAGSYDFTDTLQFILPNTGVPFTVARWIPLDASYRFNTVGSGDGAITSGPSLINAFPFLRAVVINRGADTITTTIRWLGSN